jgi:ABC-2 type transport system permease protein
VLPLLYPERGEQLSFMVQAVVLLVSGVYYSVETLPGWLQALSHLSPATYLLEGMRDALIRGSSISDEAGTLAILAVFAIVLIPSSIAVFAAAERWAKRTGRLKRHG